MYICTCSSTLWPQKQIMQLPAQPINDINIVVKSVEVFFSAPPIFNAVTVPNNNETPKPLTIM